MQVPVSAAVLSDQVVPASQKPHDVSAESVQAIVYCPCTQLEVEQVQGEGVPPGQQFSPSQVYDDCACTAAPVRSASAAAARSASGNAGGMAAWKGLQERKRARKALVGWPNTAMKLSLSAAFAPRAHGNYCRGSNREPIPHPRFVFTSASTGRNSHAKTRVAQYLHSLNNRTRRRTTLHAGIQF